MTGIDDLIICPQCLKPMGDDINTVICPHCGYTENQRFTINTLDGSIDLRDNNKPMSYKETVNLLNKFYDENEQLKQEKDKWKQQCIHFKEMLDDMAIAYLCDGWIYEELKGDVE